MAPPSGDGPSSDPGTDAGRPGWRPGHLERTSRHGARTAERRSSGYNAHRREKGKRRREDDLDAGWYAVLETLRSGSPPFQVGNYYLRDGSLTLDVIDEGSLDRAAQRIVAGLVRLLRLASGETPSVTPSGLCPWCPAITTCEPGQRYSAGRGTWHPPAEDEEDDGGN